MKNLFVLVFLFVQISFAMAQRIPSVEIKTMESANVNTTTFSNDGKPMVISFWATWCKPCIQELTAISEHYDEWQEETGVKLIAISIDDTRSFSRVAPFVNAKAWTYEVYVDTNSDFKRAMNVVNVPHTFVIDGNGNVVWQHTSYAQGDEYELYEIIEKVAAGEDVSNE